PSDTATVLDRALRARPRDQALFSTIVHTLVGGLKNAESMRRISEIAAEMIPIEKETARAARAYRRYSRRPGGGVAIVDGSRGFSNLDKAGLLLLGQELETISIVVDEQNVTLAAPFDSGLNFLRLLGLDGGMPTRVSVSRS